MTNEQQPIWYLPGPTFQYVEDVKALAREAGLRIIDANATTDRSNAAENPPEVTLKPVTGATDADYVPTKAELLAAREHLVEIRAELDAERERLAELAEQLAQQQAAAAGNPSTVESGAGAAPSVTEPAADAKPGRAARAK